GEDRKGHRPLAADIVGEDAAEQSAQPPTEDGYRNDRTRIGGNSRVFGGIQELVQRDPDGENEREHFETVERPPEVRSDQCLPLRPIERAIPRRMPEKCKFAHGSPLRCPWAAPFDGSRKSLRQYPVRLEQGVVSLLPPFSPADGGRLRAGAGERELTKRHC